VHHPGGAPPLGGSCRGKTTPEAAAACIADAANSLADAMLPATSVCETPYITTETEFYDLNTDPFELQNVASDPANAALETKLADTLHRLEFE
jgi:hypothetical protein